MHGILVRRLDEALKRIDPKRRNLITYMVTIPAMYALFPWLLARAGKSIDGMTGLKKTFKTPVNRLLAATVGIPGFILIMWSWYHMIRIGKGHPMCQPGLEAQPHPTKLITTGPFRLCRNPQTLATIMLFLSAALISNSPGFIFLGWPSSVTLLSLLIRCSEEPGLREMFGDEYEAYMSEVPRLIPTPGFCRR